MKEYLLNLYLAHKDYNRIIYTGEFADWMNVSNASISEMVRKMATKGYVVVKPYKGFYLTKEGVKKSFRYYQNFNLLKQFFEKILNVKHAETEAEKFIDASKEVMQGIEKLLGIRKRVTIKKLSEAKGNCTIIFYFGKNDDADKKGIVPDQNVNIISKKGKFLISKIKNSNINIPLNYAKKTYCYSVINPISSS